MKIRYIRGGCIYECIIDYKNITNICYSCGGEIINLMLAPLTLKVWILGWKKCRNHVDDSHGFKVEGKTYRKRLIGLKLNRSINRFLWSNKVYLLSKWIKENLSKMGLKFILWFMRWIFRLESYQKSEGHRYGSIRISTNGSYQTRHDNTSDLIHYEDPMPPSPNPRETAA